MKCHNCESAIPENQIQTFAYFVASDCQPVKSNLAIAACQKCSLIQKNTDSVWQKCCDRIYQNYRIYQQAKGKEQKVLEISESQFETRSHSLVAFLKNSFAFSSNGKIADIGCGNGAFLTAFHSSFPQWKKLGVEINETMRDTIEAISDNTSFLSLIKFQETLDVFDLLVFIHCLEHIKDPVSYLKKQRAVLSEEGILLIQVPDAEINQFDFMIADHASHFTKDSLQDILEAAGFEVLACGNLVFGKEITLLAKRSADGLKIKEWKPKRGQEIVLDNVNKLRSVLEDFEKASATQPIGVFGSSIAASWLAGIFPDRVAFFVDEDVDRIGLNHLGKEIVSPHDVAQGESVYIALEKALAEKLYRKLKSFPFTILMPPV